MSYLADSRRNFETEIVTCRHKISLAHGSFLRKLFQRSTPEKPAFFLFADHDAGALDRSTASHQEILP
jgi:hypothetical protein